MATTWWWIVQTPEGQWGWPVGEDYDEAMTDQLQDAARVLSNYPDHDDRPALARQGYDIQLSGGEPHPDKLAQLTVGTLQDLQAVPAEQIQAHRAGRVENNRRDQVGRVVGFLDSLDEQGMAELIAALNSRRPQP